MIALALVALVALVMAACGGSDDDGGSDVAGNDKPDKSSTPTETTETETESEPEPASVDGGEVFSNNCSVCHGFGGKGGNGGPDITTADDVAKNVTQVAQGGGGMPAFSGTLSEEEIQAVAEHVATL